MSCPELIIIIIMIITIIIIIIIITMIIKSLWSRNIQVGVRWGISKGLIAG